MAGSPPPLWGVANPFVCLQDIDREGLRVRKAFLFIGLLSIIWLTACGQPSTGTSTPENQPPAESQTTPQPETPDMKQELQPVKIALSVDNLVFTPIFVAREKKFFEEEGLEPQFLSLEGGGTTVQALVGRSIDFAGASGGTVVLGHSQGNDSIVNVANIVGKATLQVAMRKQLVDELQLTLETPILDRIQALRGRVFGITSPGSASDSTLLFYLEKAGVDESEVKKVAVGSGAGLVAALKQGQIDAFHTSPPNPQITELEGYGQVIISAGEVPGLDKIVYDGLITRKDIIDEKPELVKAVVNAIVRGINFTHDHTEETIELMKKIFPNTDPRLVERGVQSLLDAWPRDGLQDRTDWENTLALQQDTESIGATIPSIEEGIMWTNQFLR